MEDKHSQDSAKEEVRPSATPVFLFYSERHLAFLTVAEGKVQQGFLISFPD